MQDSKSITKQRKMDKEMLLGMGGVPWETVVGRKGTHIPVEINEDGQESPVGDERNKVPDNDDEG